MIRAPRPTQPGSTRAGFGGCPAALPLPMLRTVRAFLLSLFALALAMGAVDQPAASTGAAPADPLAAARLAGAGRVSKNVAIITLREGIDTTSAVSVERRVRAAEAAGADCIVLEIDSPGGEVGAVLRLCAAIKRTTVPRTVAWVNPNAYSGGAIAALACQEIIVADNARFGDAAPISFSPIFGVQSLGQTERAKFLAPLLGELIDSARRNGYDEKLVQAFLSLGVELWLVERPDTGQRVFIDRAEYLYLFGQEPGPAMPRVISAADAPAAPTVRPDGPEGKAGRAQPSEGTTDFKPAVPMTDGAVRDVNMSLAAKSVATTRPVFGEADKGRWKLVEYATDGKSILTLRGSDMLAWRLARGTINDDAQLKAYLSAERLGRVDPTWYEYAARWMSNPIVRGILVVLLIAGVFIEMVHPGLVAPGAVAGACALGLLLPAMLLGLAGWWEVIAIVAGILCLVLEVFVLPGFGVFGALGLGLLFTGIVMAFIPSGDLPFADPGAQWRGATYGIVSVLIGLVVTGVALYYTSKHFQALPVFGKMVLADRSGGASGDEGALGEGANEQAQAAGVSSGQTGVAITPLRPAGRVEINGQLLDVVADGGFVGAGEAVRVVRVESFRIVVERA
jgi:membrane-bound serine protease (ClpP class)